MDGEPTLLDLFCGAGGAAMGYHRAGFKRIVGVDNKPQPNYPFEFILADAMAFPLEGFDLIHASPPCQGYIQRNKNLTTKWPKLIESVRAHMSGWLYIIENVEGAPLHSPLRLCGTMFDLPLRRHRLFESSLPLIPPTACNHWGTVAHGQFAGVYARGGKGPRHGRGVREPGPRSGAPSWPEAMGITWMTDDELREAVPPAYTEHIGRAVLAAIR